MVKKFYEFISENVNENEDINLGDKVIVNTGGEDIVGIIDYGLNKGQWYKETKFGKLYRVRFTDDISKTFFGGGKYGIAVGNHDAKENTIVKSAQFIDAENINKI